MRALALPVLDRIRKQRESAVESYLVARVNEVPNAKALKVRGLRGWPDRLVLVHGRVWFVECKRPKGGKYKPLQRRVGAWLQAQGYLYAVVLTKEEVDVWLLFA